MESGQAFSQSSSEQEFFSFSSISESDRSQNYTMNTPQARVDFSRSQSTPNYTPEYIESPSEIQEEIIQTNYFDSGDIKGDTDEQARQGWSREVGKFSTWVSQTVRKLKMAHELYHVSTSPDQGQISEDNEMFANQIKNLHYKVLRNNSRNRTSYLTLFDLYHIVENWGGSLFEDPEIAENLILLLKDWERSPGFENSRFERMKSFLRLHFCAESKSIQAIYNEWLKSEYASYDLNEIIVDEKRFIYGFYFGPLMQRIDARLNCDAATLPSILELGQNNFEILKDFLDEFAIPYAGPFRGTKPIGFGSKVQLFISSVNPADKILNRQNPIFGMFEFKINSLKFSNNMDIFNALTIAPTWLYAYPPFLSGSLETVKKNFNF